MNTTENTGELMQETNIYGDLFLRLYKKKNSVDYEFKRNKDCVTLYEKNVAEILKAYMDFSASNPQKIYYKKGTKVDSTTLKCLKSFVVAEKFQVKFLVNDQGFKYVNIALVRKFKNDAGTFDFKECTYRSVRITQIGMELVKSTFEENVRLIPAEKKEKIIIKRDDLIIKKIEDAKKENQIVSNKINVDVDLNDADDEKSELTDLSLVEK